MRDGRSTTAGATLVEALVAAGLSALVVTLALGLADEARRSFRVTEDAVEQQHAARVALDLIEADLRLAGFRVHPDGDSARPDEPIESAEARAIVVRADFDASDPGASSDPEVSLAGGAFDHVSTGNDEIRGFVLRPMRGRATGVLALDADVEPAPRDGVVEPVRIDGVSLGLDGLPYTLYRVALDADPAAYGSARFAHFTPLVDHVRRLQFRYFDRAGRELAPPGGADSAGARLARAAIAQIEIEIEILTPDSDPRWLDRLDGDPRTRRKHKLALASRVLVRNAAGRGRRRRRATGRDPARARGVTLVIVLCVLVASSVLALTLALLADTERRIARNETRASQARYVAESGARVVKRWFDDPRGAWLRPEPAVVERSLRRIRNDADPEGAPIGSTPLYKEGVDADGDGNDDLFERPFDGSLEDALRGTLDGPDMRIDRADPEGGRFLDALSAALFAGFPGEGGGVRARVSRIDISSPPHRREGSGWVREGMATVRVTGRIERESASTREVLSERTVETVLAEVPYGRVFGPVHSCAETIWTGHLGVHWGTLASVGAVVISAPSEVPTSVPRAIPASLAVDPVWNSIDSGAFAAFLSAVEGVAFPDPWFRIVTAADILGIGAPPGVPQPFPPDATPVAPDRSNLFQRHGTVSCPELDYATWRSIARSGERGVHYFEWDGAAFREDGSGPSSTLADAVRGRCGIFFFDTADGAPPRDGDGDGVADNLTPEVDLDGPFAFRGVLYAHARSIRLVADPVASAATSVSPPGEPYQDLDLDGLVDPGEAHLDLAYPATAAEVALPILAGAPGGVQDPRGAPIPDVEVSLHGILFNRGRFDATGRGTVYGSIVAAAGIVQSTTDGSAPTPRVLWDASLVSEWPPPGWSTPRVRLLRARFDP